MTTRTRTPSHNRRKTYVRDLGNGIKLTAEISPCVFMYPGYPLQLSVTLSDQTGKSLGEGYPTDRSKTSSTYTDAAVRSLFDAVRVIPCPQCATPAFDPATIDTHRGGLCKECFTARLNAEWAAEEKTERRAIATRDRRMKRDGMAVRVTAWVHPKNGGDDYQVDWYLDAHPTRENVRDLLRKQGSDCLDDYQIITL